MVYARDPRCRVRPGIHLGGNAEAPEVRAVEIADSHIGDAPALPDPLSQMRADEEIGSITANGAYDTRKCHAAIAGAGA